MKTMTAYIALGSNLGDRRGAIEGAIKLLDESEGVKVERFSKIIETAPVGPPNQPSYLNAAIEVSTTLSARALLDRSLAIELELGRDRADSPRWGPRTVDLDLLLFGDQIINEPGLRVPHPRLHERAFVLQPLAEIAPHAVHPLYGVTVESLWRRIQTTSKRLHTGEHADCCSCRQRNRD